MDGGNLKPQPALSLAELEAQITELAGHLNAANYRWLVLIGEFDRRHGWADGRLHSCAHWLNFKCGLNLGAAREKVRVAHALEGLPKIAVAMARGELSYSKVRALTRVAGEGTEEYFLSIALHGTAHHVERLARYYRRAHEAEELSREARQQANRSVSYWFDADGSLVLKARLPALALLAEKSLKRGLKISHTADRYQVVVHVDEETLRSRTAGRCEIEQGPSLPAETVRRLACDASLVAVLENQRGEALDVGRRTRSIPPAIRRALHARDPGCRFPGCTHQRFLDAHHIRHWADGGETKIGNLVTLCRFHHRLVHEGAIYVQLLCDGTPRFLRPDGTVFDGIVSIQTPSYDCKALQDTHAEQGIRIDAGTAATRWRGERMDYGLAIEVLQQQAERARNVSAETREAESSGGASHSQHGAKLSE